MQFQWPRAKEEGDDVHTMYSRSWPDEICREGHTPGAPVMLHEEIRRRDGLGGGGVPMPG